MINEESERYKIKKSFMKMLKVLVGCKIFKQGF